MNPAVFAIRRKAFTLFVVALLAILGLQSYANLGWLEDPVFSIKTATVYTAWPGASPLEVERQVTERIERAVQEIPELDHVRSLSRAGESIVFVDIDDRYRSSALPQIWDLLRRKVADVQGGMPEGAGPSQVNDDYGDVYGVLLAVYGDGVPFARLSDYVEALQRELLLIEGVSRAVFWGERQETIEITVSGARLANLGLTADEVLRALSTQNRVVPAGALESGRDRFRVDVPGTFDAVEDVGDLVVGRDADDRLVLVRDIADVRRAVADPLPRLMRFNGHDAMAIGLSPVASANIVSMGEAVRARLDALEAQRPVGLEVGIISDQPAIVDRAIASFVVSLVAACAIVLGVVWLFMGLRGGLIVGLGLVLTILATMVVMRIAGIDLQRMSVGAMIVGLGILVDNAIVVTDYILVRMKRGDGRVDAAARAVRDLSWPLLGATLVAIAAFLPIFLSPDQTGEYVATLFSVIAIALVISWVLAITVTPVLCHMLLRAPATGTADPFSGPVFAAYRGALRLSLRHRLLILGLMAGMIGLSGYGFTFVSQNFFPSSNRTAVMLDYWLPEGAHIDDVSEDLRAVEAHFLGLDPVVSVATFVGAGPVRFQISLNPEIPYQSYGQVIIELESADHVPAMVAHGDRYLVETFPQAEPRMRVFPLATTEAFKIEARFSGPDPVVLQGLAEAAMAILAAEPGAKYVRHDWRQMTRTIRPAFDQPRARRAGVTREDVAFALARVTDGARVGAYREGDDRLPIVWRLPAAERHDAGRLEQVQVYSQAAGAGVPLGQVVSGIDMVWEQPLIWRRDRQRTITVQADPQGMEAYELQARVQAAIEAIPLPEGYMFEWGGEYEGSVDGQANVNAQVPIGMIITLIILVALFNGLRQPVIIFLTVPLCIVGVTVGLLLTGEPFGFMALLGVLSLQGMLIKNGIVLVDQVETGMRDGLAPYDAVLAGSIGRLVSITVGALTTALGLIPLLFDTFFRAMAVSIMGGLLFGTVLTLIVLPVLYTLAFRIGTRPRAGGRTPNGSARARVAASPAT
ncbi:efflux RND transporter permease subunit [Roseospira visakhapatnamensis]|uniref:Multidrug efflux pump subunit AcrB n=1 Tax=Roseospira visakhapatnamensis TaxID=390880 RepID=A0A7W6RED8_9PROT|nr:multidrug efflux pump subunit AcrB [Roseospira visakhapatnamensis]